MKQENKIWWTIFIVYLLGGISFALHQAFGNWSLILPILLGWFSSSIVKWIIGKTKNTKEKKG